LGDVLPGQRSLNRLHHWRIQRLRKRRRELIRIGPIRLFGAAVHAAPARGRRNLSRTLPLTLVTLAAGAAAAVPPSAAASGLEPEALTQARVIRAEVNARYRLVPGRELAVTEATSTEVVKSLSLVTDWLELPQVVPADNGIYFAICSARATCPYPVRSAAWPAAAFLPRRAALELGLRTLAETSVSLVVVALPTAKPVWVVLQREDLLARIDGRAVLEQLSSDPAVLDPTLRELLSRLTRLRLFCPLPILPPPDDTIYAVRLFSS
jgi:hypothetical protein